MAEGRQPYRAASWPRTWSRAMIYIASPYSHPEAEVRQQRFEAVRDFCAALIQDGKFPYSPIVHCHPIAVAQNLPGDAAWWRRYNFNTLRRCDSMIVLKLRGWSESKGVAEELELAATLGLSIAFEAP